MAEPVKAKIIIFYVVIAIVAFGAYHFFVAAKEKFQETKNNLETRIERGLGKPPE